jgi:hypothetical protein
MSLTVWSLIIFATYSLFYLSMLFAVMLKTSVTKIATMVVCWMVYQIATLWYGLATDQIGFILMFIFQFIVTILTVIISTERSINEDI